MVGSVRIAGVLLVAMSATTGTLMAEAPAAAAPQECVEFTSDGLELAICTTLSTPSPGSARAQGHTVELHEYLRPDHVVVVRLQQQTATGAWTTVASAEGQDAEGATATTNAVPVAGPVRACATGGLRGHEQATVCTS